MPDPVRRIVLATDLGAAARPLYAEALGLAVRARAELWLVHVDDPAHPEATWRTLPTVRDLLARWGHLEPGAPPEDLERLGVRVRTVERGAAGGPIGPAVARAVAGLSPDLVVVGTAARSGFERLLHGSVGQEIARDVHPATLLVPQQARGLVHELTGGLRLQRVLVPVTTEVPYEPVISTLRRLVAAVDPGPVTVHFVHVGAAGAMPALSPPAWPHWTWATEVRGGAVVDGIVDAARESEADLVAMATSGHDSFLDAVRGSTLERVLQRVGRPVLAVRV